VRFLACAPGPNFSVADVHAGWVEALRAAGQQVVDYPLGDALTFYDAALVQAGPHEFRKALTPEQATHLAGDRLAGALYKSRPDVLLLTSGFFLDPQLLDLARHDGVKVVLIATEQPYELTRELDLARHCDITLLTDPVTLAEFAEVCTAIHAPHAYRPTVHTPGRVDPALSCDFAFVGTGYESRIAFLEAMDLQGLDVLLGGNWGQLTDDSPLRPFIPHDPANCLDNADAVDVYRSMRVGMNLYRREAESPERAAGWAVGPREIELAAIGAFFLRDPRPEGDELFPSLPTFTGPEESSELLRWYLAHPDAREDAATKAREAVIGRTFDNNAAALLRLLDKE
jgi:spore maturation protein CgeB